MTNEELAVKIKAGDRELVPVLWDQVKSLVYWKARQRYLLTDGFGGADIEDLVQSGFLGLLETVEIFDPDAGAGFLTVLDWKLKTAFSEAAGGRSKRRSRDPLNYAASLDEPLTDDGDSSLTLLDTIPDDRDDFEDVDEKIWTEQLRDALDHALDDLPENEKNVVRRRFYDGMTLREIAEADGVSHELVRQREKNALMTMKRRQHRYRLNEFIEQHRRELDEDTPWFLSVSVDEFNRTRSSAVEKLVLMRDEKAQRAYRAYRHRLLLEAERCAEGNPQSLDDAERVRQGSRKRAKRRTG